MSQIKYCHLIQYDSGEVLIGAGKGKRSGTTVTIPEDGSDWVRHEYERVDYWELPEPMPKSEFGEWYNENKDDGVEPIPSILETIEEVEDDE